MAFDANVIYHYPLDGDFTETIAGQTGSLVGILTWDAAEKKYGSASVKDFGNANYWTIPQAVLDALGLLPAFSIGFYIKEPTPAPGYALNSYVGFYDGAPGGNYEIAMALNVSTNTVPWKSRIICNGQTVGGGLDGNSYETWSYCSLEWDGANCKFYVDEGLGAGPILIATHASALNPFSGPNAGRTMRMGREFWNGDYFRGWMDHVLISNIARAGVEPLALPGGAFGFSKDSFAGGRISKGGFR